MNIEAIIIEDDMTPAVTIREAFTHMGHIMSVHIINDARTGEISWGVETVHSGNMKAGFYPINHAEIDACYIIRDELEKLPYADGLNDCTSALLQAIVLGEWVN
jgi:hypothetical protein